MKQLLPTLLLAATFLLSTTTVSAQNGPLRLVVTSGADTRDVNPGDAVCDDGSGDCTLRAAVDEANANGGEVIIVLPGRLPGGNVGTYTLSRVAPNVAANTYEDNNAYGDLDLTGMFSSLWIQGTGTPGPTITSSPNDRILDVGSGKQVKLTRVAITGGTAKAGDNGSSTNPDATNGGNGGGLRIGDGANVTIDQAAFTGNFTQSGGNGATPASSIPRVTGGDAGNGGDGGAIYIGTGANVTINRTTIAGNGTGDAGSAGSGQGQNADGGAGGDGGNGGGIYNKGTLTVTNSTIFNNTLGGGKNGGPGVNGGAQGAAGLGGSGGGIANAQDTGSGVTDQGSASLTNSIVAGNSSGQSPASTPEPGPDLFDASNGSTFGLSSNNLIGNNDGVTNLTGSLVGTAANVIDAVITGINSGSDFAVPAAVIGSGSPAINAGTSTTSNNYDARGYERPFGGAADIGAYEANSRPITTTLKLVEIDVNSSQSDDEFVEIKNTGNFAAQMDDHVLVGFGSDGTSCVAFNLYGELQPGELFTVGESAIMNKNHNITLDATSATCGGGDNLFADDNGAVALYNGGTANIGTGFAAGSKSAEREDVIVYDNTNNVRGGTPASGRMDLCGAFGLGSGCAASDPGDGASIQVDAGGNVYTGTPSPGVNNNGQALPVELVTFGAQATASDEITLTWTTLTERQNAGFAVERLVDGNWEELTWIAGAGDSETATDYRHVLRRQAAGIHTFRLQQEDYDGTRTASDAVSVRLTGTGSVGLSPNPTSNASVLTLELPTAEARLTVSLLDAFGRQLYTVHDGAMDAGLRTLDLDLSAYPAGLYYVKIQQRDEVSVQALQRH